MFRSFLFILALRVQLFIVFRFGNSGENCGDLLLEQWYQLFEHALVQLVLLAEVFSQILGLVTFINHNRLSAVFSDFDADNELGFLLLVVNFFELFVDQCLAVWFSTRVNRLLVTASRKDLRVLMLTWRASFILIFVLHAVLLASTRRSSRLGISRIIRYHLKMRLLISHPERRVMLLN